MPFNIIRNDLTRVCADAIVNTANPEPQYGRGTDYAIYQAAGTRDLLAARGKVGEIAPGEAAVTSAFRLPAKYLIHTVGPVWQGGDSGETEILASCYRKSLLLAEQLGCKSIAFPLISAGTYGFPRETALNTALSTIEEFLLSSDMDVTLVVFNKEAFQLSQALVEDVRQYVDDHYVEQAHEMSHPSCSTAPNYISGSIGKASGRPRRRRRSRREENIGAAPAPISEVPKEDLSEMAYCADMMMPGSGEDQDTISLQVEETFQQMLLRYIDERHMSDVEVYKKANVDRKLFSKIRCNPDYRPSKKTALALAVALELNLDQTVDLLARAELALSPSIRFDLVIRYCIEREIYNIYDINALLFEYDLPLLAG